MHATPDLDDLIRRVRAEAAQPQYQPARPEPIVPLPPPVHAAPAAPAPHGAAAPDRHPAHSFGDLLLAGDDRDFIEQAYLALLHRAPDPDGLAHFGKLLQSGCGRPIVLGALRASPEARNTAAALTGFGLAPWVYLLWRVADKLRLRPLAGIIDSGYSAWRNFTLAGSGRAFTHLAAALADTRQHGEQLRTHLDDHIVRLDTRLDDQAAVSAARFAEFDSALVTRDGALRSELAARLDDHAAASAARFAECDSTLATRDGALRSELAARLTAAITPLTADQARTATALQAQAAEIRLLRACLKILQLRAVDAPPPAVAPGSPPAAPRHDAPPDAEVDARIDAFYLAFEEAHRGSETEIHARLAPYLQQLAGLPAALLARPVLDIGCGRGEWLRLLADHGFTATGIDLNPHMVARCRSLGLQVDRADAVAHLASLPTGSHAAISAFHLFEHLPFAVLFQLIEQAWRVLAPGGILIVETPNPENVLVGSHTFYHDFSHRNPVTPTALQFLAGYHGFEAPRILRLNPYPPEARITDAGALGDRINGHLYGPQDFALCATKPAADA